jgi:hypothetical protein
MKRDLTKESCEMKVIMLEGTPEEIKKVAHLFVETSLTETINESASSRAVGPDVEPVDAIRHMLTRIPISKGQLAAYKALKNGKTKYSEYLNHTKRKASQIAGLHGALGRRINNTPEIHRAGLPGNTAAIFVWTNEGGEEHLDLTSEAREALEAEGII